MSHNLVLIETARKLADQHGFDGPSLREAIPYLEAFQGKKFVLKIGGSVLNDINLIPQLVSDIAFLKRLDIGVILVHGGSHQLDKAMKEDRIVPEKIDGLRVTTKDILKLADSVFSGISKLIKAEIDGKGYQGIIFNRSNGLVCSKQKRPELGYVGEPVKVDISVLSGLSDNAIPIVSAITSGIEPNDIGFNVNADEVASAIAKEIKAEKLILMTDEDGVKDKDGKLLPTLTTAEVEALIEKGIIRGGMIPKVQACLAPLAAGVKKSHIIKGEIDSFINEILTDTGVGTEFVAINSLQSIKTQSITN